MNFRRLLACSPSKLDDAAVAPAGPGVWILSDEDLSTYYYVESCKTLRVAIGQLLRGSARSGLPIKPQLAEHLGIPRRVWRNIFPTTAWFAGCRWTMTPRTLRGFLIAVLRPTLNE